MTAEVIQFVPKANSNRLTMVEAEEVKTIEFMLAAPALIGLDTTPSDYTAPDGDCA